MTNAATTGVLVQHDDLITAWVDSLANPDLAKDLEMQERFRQRYHRLITSELWRQA